MKQKKLRKRIGSIVMAMAMAIGSLGTEMSLFQTKSTAEAATTNEEWNFYLEGEKYTDDETIIITATKEDLEEESRSTIARMYMKAVENQNVDDQIYVEGENGTHKTTKFYVYQNRKTITDTYGNTWEGTEVEAVNNWQAAPIPDSELNVSFLINVRLVSMSSKQAGNTLEIPSSLVLGGTTYTVVSLYGGDTVYTPTHSTSKVSYLETYGIKTIRVPETIISIEMNGMCYNSENEEKYYSVKFDNVDNIEYIGYKGLGNHFNLNIEDINALIDNGTNLQNSAFENCSSVGKIELNSPDIYIPHFAFKNAKGITGIITENKVQNLFIGNCAFYGNKNFNIESLKAENVNIGQYAFAYSAIAGDIVFDGNVDLGKHAFFYGVCDDTRITFKNGNVNIDKSTFACADNISEIKFEDTCGNIEIQAGAFLDTEGTRKLKSLDFRGTGDVILHDSSLAFFSTLEELQFHNKGIVTFKGSPFYGSAYFEYNSENVGWSGTEVYNREDYETSINHKLKNIIFACSDVKFDNFDTYKYRSFPSSQGYVSCDVDNREKYSTFYGLYALTSITCTEKVEKFAIYRYAKKNPDRNYEKNGDYNLVDFSFYNSNMKPNDINISDVRTNGPYKPVQTCTYRGFQNISDFVQMIIAGNKTNYNNKEAEYKAITRKLSVSLTSPNKSLDYGQDLATEDISVGIVYQDFEGNNVYTELSPKTETADGYEMTESKVLGNYNKQTGGTKVYSITYGGMMENIEIPVNADRIKEIEVVSTADEATEGQSLSLNDFYVTKIGYASGATETTNCNALLDKSKFIVSVEGTDDNKLKAGTNKIVITYEDASTMIIMNAKAYEISSIYSVQLRDVTKKYMENDVISSSAVKVAVQYSNGYIDDDYKSFTMEDVVLQEGENTILVFVGDYSKSVTVEAIPRKVISIRAVYIGEPVPEGEQLDDDKIMVTATYTDNTTKLLDRTEYTILNYKIVAGTTTPVYILYGNDMNIRTSILVIGTENPSAPVETTKPNVTTEPSITTSAPSPVPTATIITTTSPTIQPSKVPATNTPNSTPGTDIKTNDNNNVPNAGGNITPESPSTVAADLGKVTLGVKENCTLTVKGADIASYSSSDSTVAAVTSTGKITAMKVGTAVITVTTTTGAKGTYTVTVKKAPKKIGASFKKKTLKKGKQITLKPKFAAGYYSNKVTYKSSNKKIATVSSKGVIKAKKKGTCKITMTTYNGKKIVVKIVVK